MVDILPYVISDAVADPGHLPWQLTPPNSPEVPHVTTRSRRWFAETAGGLPRDFWVLWGGTLVNRLGAFVVIFLAFYLTAGRGFSAAFAGLVIGLSGAGGAAGVLFGGVLADRWGRRPTLFTGHLATAVAMLGLGLSRAAWLIAVWGVALGVFSNLVRPAFQAMMVDVVPTADRFRAFSLNYWAINLGFAFSAALAGAVAQVDFLLLFVIDAATTFVTAVGIFVLVPETRPVRAAPEGRRHDGGGGLRTVFRDPVFLTITGLTTLLMTVVFQHLTALPIAMASDGLPPSAFGVVIALNGVLIVLGQLLVSRRIRGYRRARLLAVAAVLTGTGFGLTAWADTVPLYALTVVVWTVGEMVALPAQATVVAELAPAHLRGSYQGVFSLGFSVASFAAPVGGGWVFQHLGGTTLWVGCLAVGLLAAVGFLASGPALTRRLAALRPTDVPLPSEPQPSELAAQDANA